MLENSLQSLSSRKTFLLSAMERTTGISFPESEKETDCDHLNEVLGFFGQDSTNSCIFKTKLNKNKHAKRKQHI